MKKKLGALKNEEDGYSPSLEKPLKPIKVPNELKFFPTAHKLLYQLLLPLFSRPWGFNVSVANTIQLMPSIELERLKAINEALEKLISRNLLPFLGNTTHFNGKAIKIIETDADDLLLELLRKLLSSINFSTKSQQPFFMEMANYAIKYFKLLRITIGIQPTLKSRSYDGLYEALNAKVFLHHWQKEFHLAEIYCYQILSLTGPVIDKSDIEKRRIAAKLTLIDIYFRDVHYFNEKMISLLENTLKQATRYASKEMGYLKQLLTHTENALDYFDKHQNYQKMSQFSQLVLALLQELSPIIGYNLKKELEPHFKSYDFKSKVYLLCEQLKKGSNENIVQIKTQYNKHEKKYYLVLKFEKKEYAQFFESHLKQLENRKGKKRFQNNQLKTVIQKATVKNDRYASSLYICAERIGSTAAIIQAYEQVTLKYTPKEPRPQARRPKPISNGPSTVNRVTQTQIKRPIPIIISQPNNKKNIVSSKKAPTLFEEKKRKKKADPEPKKARIEEKEKILQWKSGRTYPSDKAIPEEQHTYMLTSSYMPDNVWFGYMPNNIAGEELTELEKMQFLGRLEKQLIAYDHIRMFHKKSEVSAVGTSIDQWKFKIVIPKKDKRVYGWIEEKLINPKTGEQHIIVCFGYAKKHKAKLPTVAKAKKALESLEKACSETENKMLTF